eukprot:3892146-Rhodomonas_salina.1
MAVGRTAKNGGQGLEWQWERAAKIGGGESGGLTMAAGVGVQRVQRVSGNGVRGYNGDGHGRAQRDLRLPHRQG